MRRLRQLRLTHFRNYPALDLQLSGAPVVLFGANGAGKTNLLESLSLFSPGQGLRRARTEDLALKDDSGAKPDWGVVATLDGGPDGEFGPALQMAVGQVPEKPGRRQIKIDGKSATSSELASHVSLMWMTPAHDRLFTGSASERRKFIDRFALAHFPDHGTSLLRYEKARANRNRLLSDGSGDGRWYDALEADMAKYGSAVEAHRHYTVARLTEEIDKQVTSRFPQAQIALASDVIEDGAPIDVDSLAERLLDTLARGRMLDLRAGRSLRGVHRSDLIVHYKDKNVPAADSSTGEQKALLIGLFLAQIRSASERLRILLLDEVAAHLDEDRRAALIEELLGLDVQLFMTGTDQSLFSAFGDQAQMFRVSGGQLFETDMNAKPLWRGQGA